MDRATVWLVMHDDDADDPVLAVCGSRADAHAVMTEVAGRFPEGAVFLAEYPLGWRYDDGARRYSAH